MMYIDAAPIYFFVITSILAIVLTLFIVVRLIDYVTEVIPRRWRTRRFLHQLNADKTIDEYYGSLDALDDEVRRYHEGIKQATENHDGFDNEKNY